MQRQRLLIFGFSVYVSLQVLLFAIILVITAQTKYTVLSCLSQIICYRRNLKCLASCLPEIFFFPGKDLPGIWWLEQQM